MTFILTTLAFAMFLTMHLLTGYEARAHERARTVGDRRTSAHRVVLLFYTRAVWFAGLFAAAGWVVVSSTSSPPWLEIAVVYGAIIAIVTSLSQARRWAVIRDQQEPAEQTVTTSDGRTVTVPAEILALIEQRAAHMEGEAPHAEGPER